MGKILCKFRHNTEESFYYFQYNWIHCTYYLTPSIYNAASYTLSRIAILYQFVRITFSAVYDNMP